MGKLATFSHSDIALTFDDVVLVPQYSDVVPSKADVSTKLTNKISLGIPLVSAAMDTVTESSTSIALAIHGGMGVIHRNNTVEQQVQQVKLVKGFELDSPTNAQRVAASISKPAVDSLGRLIVGAAVGVNDSLRVKALIDAGVNCLVVDTAHGHSKAVLDAVKAIKADYPDAQVIAGNVSTKDGAADLISAGADAVKVGQGPGSICTTRVVTGAGMAQLTAILECAIAGQEHGVPVIADGGIRYSGDIAKSIGAGASAVMIGSLFAGTDESPGNMITLGSGQYKQYRGMGSIGAMMDSQGAKARYHQENVTSKEKLVPEGIEGVVPYKGPIAQVVFQLIGGLRSGMGYCGCQDIAKMRENAKFARITVAGGVESHPHDITITNQAPNYPVGKV